ncbi:MAG: thioredoxin [Chloroflexi bacterium OLB15]|nr:MAG: thioredoxin [Chloroflexi bacterium OLB15]
MREPITLTDQNLDEVLATDKPIFVLITNGDGLKGDFKTAFQKQADEDSQYLYARLDPTRNPRAAQMFSASDKPLLVGWYCGEEMVRRSRPWGSDLPLALEAMKAILAEKAPPAATPEENPTEIEVKKPMEVINKPVNVTDETFEQEVLQSDLPVLVDFWAAWCGPCRMVAPILDKLAGEYAGKLKIVKVDTDANPGLSQAFRITSIPNLMVVKDRTIIFNQPGALPEAAFRQLIEQVLVFEVPPREEQENAQPLQ